MQPQTLRCRGPDGLPTIFSPEGTEVMDGSLHADIPVQRLTELFNAQLFVVSQTNPHAIDFVRDGAEGSGHGSQAASSKTCLGAVEQTLQGMEKHLQADIAHRLMRLARLKVIPKVYGQNFEAVLTGNQSYTGDINSQLPHRAPSCRCCGRVRACYG